MKGLLSAYNLSIGNLPTGRHNQITDVPGVTVGHTTISAGNLHTGVTVIHPCSNNPFVQKPVAAVHVLNGFGKAAGLMQVQELGTLETPIALTGTLNVGRVFDALVTLSLERAAREGVEVASLNPLVLECNDGRLSDLPTRPIGLEQVRKAWNTASTTFEEGSIGAGRGMICHGLKGGIGSASRVVTFDDQSFTVGVLVLTNHGSLSDLTLCSKKVGKEIVQGIEKPDAGSVIVVLATDLPVSDRQVRRILTRCTVGLARVGNHIGHGSGEVFLGFTTANRMPQTGEALVPMKTLREDLLNPVFRATVEATEEAVIASLLQGTSTVGLDGVMVHALTDYFPQKS